jgi:hypothetical protein
MIASATTIRFELSILIYADLNIASLIFPKLVQYLLAQLVGQAWPPADVTCVAVSCCRKPYGLQFFYLLEFVTFRTQSIGGRRQRKIAPLLWPNVEIVIVVFEIPNAAE